MVTTLRSCDQLYPCTQGNARHERERSRPLRLRTRPEVLASMTSWCALDTSLSPLRSLNPCTHTHTDPEGGEK
jgi:hypothetical protein